jgi:hypothetical protein
MNGIRGKTEDGDDLPSTPSLSSTEARSPLEKPSDVESPITKCLRFLSTATPETLGAIAVGLAAATWLILGKLGLILIGALGGVVLHATWEGQSTLVGAEGNAKQQQGIDVVARILKWRDARSTEEEEEGDEEVHIGDSFEDFRPETRAALNDFVDAVIRDYVKWWYNPILPKESSFPAASRQTLTKFMLSLTNHLSRKRPADSFLDFLTNSSSIVIVFLNELSSALSTQAASVPAAEAVYTYLSANPDSNLANVLNEKQQMKKFRMIADDILQNFLEKPAYACDPARVFLREILAGVVLDMTLKSCSKPEWINGWIVSLLEDGEPDISHAIDIGMANAPEANNLLNDIDGNVGNVGLAKPLKSPVAPAVQEFKKHQKRLSKAEEAMEEAMEEARRLSELMAEEDAKKQAPEKTSDIAPMTSMAVVETGTLGRAVDSTNLQSISPRTPNQPVENFPDTSPTQNRTLDSPGSTTSPKQVRNTNTPPTSPPKPASKSFTNFDQIVPQSSIPDGLQEKAPLPRRKTVSLTLLNANIIIHDDSTSADKGLLRNKPNTEYLIQIEPASSDHPGWMIVRKYPDFETLHEVLRRIAKLSGVVAFSEQHNTLPNWKEHTKASLRGELERYVRDACWDRHLAESEGMKRFLEKDSQNTTGSAGKIGFGWPAPSAIETMGKGMLDVLASAPRGVADGGKALSGGITGVFNNIGKEIGNLGQKKSNASATNVSTHIAGRSSTSTLPRIDSSGSMAASMYSNRRARASEDSLRAVPLVATQPSKVPPMERRPSYQSIAEVENERESRTSTSARSSMSGPRSATHSRAPSRKGTPLNSPTQVTMEGLKLPPPPSAISEDYCTDSTVNTDSTAPSRTSISTAPSQPSPGRVSMSTPRGLPAPINTSPRKQRAEPTPMTEEETRVAVELLFAVISELYTLSSAWKFRRTLLNAAKTFLLRPGNPSLSSIQSLIQDSVITSNTSDAGIATHVRKLRQNSLPTEEELKAWPAEMTPEGKERLRLKARKLLVERGVPVALSGVMGQAATSEAMGRIFDCLQIEEVNRGLMFGMLLQCVRVVTQ